jgi:flagellar biosynthesis protein FliR
MDDTLLWVQTAMLAAVRLTLGLAMTPLFAVFGVPMLARLVLTLSFAGLAATMALPAVATHAQLSVGYLIPAIANELALGLLLSVGVHSAFAAFSVAGRLIDAQMGFTLGAVLDPVSKGHAAVISSGMNMLAILMFFVSDAHHWLLAGFFRTFELLPVGQPLSVEGWLPMAVGSGAMFSIGFVIASPVVVALLLADVVVAVISRNLPQMNVMFLSIPLKVLLGMAVMAVAVRVMGPAVQKALTLPITLLDKVQ